MATLIEMKRSPYWWIDWFNPDTGKRQKFSTKLRRDVTAATKQAKKMLAEYQARELGGATNRGRDHWEAWVPAWIQSRFARSPRQKDNAMQQWQTVEEFLKDQGITRPAELTRADCFDFVDWKIGKTPDTSINTVIVYLGRLRNVMAEAVRRDFAVSNPASNLQIRGREPTPRPEMTDEEIAKIRDYIANKKRIHVLTNPETIHALRVSFEFGLLQGFRLSETRLDIYTNIDLANRIIRIHAKGDSFYETALNPKLIPLVEELRAEGRRMTYDYDPRNLSTKWSLLFKQLGMSHLCFHCTRVTCISRLERAGAPESAVMQLVNHASKTIHRIYRRHTKGELEKYWD